VDEGFPWLAQAEVILFVHVIWMQLDLNGLPHHLVHVSVFGGQRAGVLEMDAMTQADAVFGHGQFIWMLHTNVLVVLLDPGFSATASLPNVNSTTITGYAVHVWSFESQVVLHVPKEVGDLPRWEAHRLCAWRAPG
jgi:hypothetical protein